MSVSIYPTTPSSASWCELPRTMGESHHDEILDELRDRVADRPVYVSVDVDVLDPGFAPGTGTPEPGGLSSRELLSLLRGLVELPIVGADVVEVAPAYDHAQITALAAAHVVYELVSVMAIQQSADAVGATGRRSKHARSHG